MSLTIGLIGKPNIGKSTFFKSLTLSNVDIGNYPFTTINPNYGIAYIQSQCPCVNTKKKCNLCNNGIRYIPINIIDIAGLVPDSHLGKGLGNKFLDDIRQADFLIHIVDISGSTDSEGNTVQIGMNDPSKDILFLNKEIELWIYSILKKNWEKLVRKIKNDHLNINIALANQLSGAGINEYHINYSIKKLKLETIDISNWSEEIILNFCHELFLNSKKMIFVGNKIDKLKVSYVDKLKVKYPSMYFTSSEVELILKTANKQGYISYIPGSNTFSIIQNKNLTTNQLNGLKKIYQFLKDFKSTGVQQCLNSIIFDILKMIVVYPVEDENKWCNKKGIYLPTSLLMYSGSTCLDLAKKIHTDMSSTFLYAIDGNTKKRLSEKYVLKNNDVIKIVFTSHK